MIDKAAILQEILTFSQERPQPVLQEGDLTYRDIEAAHGWGHEKARRVMAGLVEQGKFERLELGGKVKVVFRKVATAT